MQDAKGCFQGVNIWGRKGDRKQEEGNCVVGGSGVVLASFPRRKRIFGAFFLWWYPGLCALPNVVRNVKVLNRIENYVEHPTNF